MRARTFVSILLVLMIIAGAVVVGVTVRKRLGKEPPSPWEYVKQRPAATVHEDLYEGIEKFESGPAVTEACLKCHEDASFEVMNTSHWTWLSEKEVLMPGRDRPLAVGKKNIINNFCIALDSNWKRCTTCHVGYGWVDNSFDFGNPGNVDCLICHDQSGQYARDFMTDNSLKEGVDLLAAAKSVGYPGRKNCGACHFYGGGGDAVKHGDIDSSLGDPTPDLDVHMGKNNFSCVDCHATEKHRISGRAVSVNAEGMNELRCTDCHPARPHKQARLNDHIDALACQSCHVPTVARGLATKVAWDWSQAGKDVGPDVSPHLYAKKKGAFIYEKNVVPEYFWFNGKMNRYVLGDKINPEPDGVTKLNYPLGGIEDPDSRIWPFKVHRGKQIYDAKNRYLLVPKLFGKGGYWATYDWNLASKLGSEVVGLAYSGEYGFTETDMHWRLTHMVPEKGGALQCTDCHGEGNRMDWEALGYGGDPAYIGGRKQKRLLVEKEGGL